MQLCLRQPHQISYFYSFFSSFSLGLLQQIVIPIAFIVVSATHSASLLPVFGLRLVSTLPFLLIPAHGSSY